VPGLEIHTLDHEYQEPAELLDGVYWNDLEMELDELLLERARAATDGGIAPPETEKTPEKSGVFSLGGSVVYSVLGDRLGDISSMVDKKERLAMFPISLGALASASTISMTTGCWSLVNAWRDEKGYAFIWNPEEYGYQVEKSGNFRGMSVHRMAYNMKRRATGRSDLTRYQQLDHICRWPGCCNIDHLNVVDHKKNNKNRDQARILEAALYSGQIILGPTGMPWLDGRLADSETENTNILVATPAGPFRIVKVDDEPLMFRGQAEPSELHQAVPPPAPKKYERNSRVKRIVVDPEQKNLFADEPYIGRRLRKIDLYKAWRKTGQP